MILETLRLLNEATVHSLDENDEKTIISTFTELAINILGASFGFVWMEKGGDKFELAYRSPRLPYTPLSPKKSGRNTRVLKSFQPDFVATVKKRKDKYDVSKYMSSFVIIPIVYQTNVYGNIVICFKKKEPFLEQKRILCSLIGSNVAHVLTIHRDKKHLKDSEEYQTRLKEEELRTEFLADAMHEIRTPLAIIRGTVDLALKSPRAVSQGAVLRSVDEEVKRLSEIFSELSTLTSKNSIIERKMHTKEVKLAPFIIMMTKRWRILAHKGGASIQVKKIPDVSILADEPNLDKIFTNIIKNAITYGKKNGHIRISGSMIGDKVKIDISDDGIGINPHDLKRIFDRFYRVDKSRTRVDGTTYTGLGLAIVRWIAEAHGGQVTAESVPGKGTTFSVWLPVI